MDCFCGAKGEVACVCATQLELGWTPEENPEEVPDTRTEWTHIEDFNPPPYAERYEERP